MRMRKFLCGLLSGYLGVTAAGALVNPPTGMAILVACIVSTVLYLVFATIMESLD